MRKELPRIWKYILTAGLFLLLLAALAYIFRVPLLRGIGNYLVVNDELHPADILFLLNGGYETRPFYASNLYHQGFAPRVVIVRVEPSQAELLGLIPNETDIAIGILERTGVPPEDIIQLTIEGGATSTFDEAAALRRYVEAQSISRVIVVTSAFHTRRARWIFEKKLEGLPVALEMAAVPYAGYDAANWWLSEGGLIEVNNEYIKLFYYLLKYH